MSIPEQSGDSFDFCVLFRVYFTGKGALQVLLPIQLPDPFRLIRRHIPGNGFLVIRHSCPIRLIPQTVVAAELPQRILPLFQQLLCSAARGAFAVLP